MCFLWSIGDVYLIWRVDITRQPRCKCLAETEIDPGSASLLLWTLLYRWCPICRLHNQSSIRLLEHPFNVAIFNVKYQLKGCIKAAKASSNICNIVWLKGRQTLMRQTLMDQIMQLMSIRSLRLLWPFVTGSLSESIKNLLYQIECMSISFIHSVTTEASKRPCSRTTQISSMSLAVKLLLKTHSMMSWTT